VITRILHRKGCFYVRMLSKRCLDERNGVIQQVGTSEKQYDVMGYPFDGQFNVFREHFCIHPARVPFLRGLAKPSPVFQRAFFTGNVGRSACGKSRSSTSVGDATNLNGAVWTDYLKKRWLSATKTGKQAHCGQHLESRLTQVPPSENQQSYRRRRGRKDLSCPPWAGLRPAASKAARKPEEAVGTGRPMLLLSVGQFGTGGHTSVYQGPARLLPAAAPGCGGPTGENFYQFVESAQLCKAFRKTENSGMRQGEPRSQLDRRAQNFAKHMTQPERW